MIVVTSHVSAGDGEDALQGPGHAFPSVHEMPVEMLDFVPGVSVEY